MNGERGTRESPSFSLCKKQKHRTQIAEPGVFFVCSDCIRSNGPMQNPDDAVTLRS